MKKIVIDTQKFEKRSPSPSAFQSLVRSIIFQQLSGTAATSILNKFIALFPQKKFPIPQDVLALSAMQFKQAGVSSQKANYLQDLALKFTDGTLVPRKFARMEDTEIIEHLVVVKGVGVWTAQMFLIFHLGRPNVLPVGDLAIRKGFQKVFGLKGEPTEKKMRELALPYEGRYSMLARHLWSVMDAQKVKNKKLAKSSPDTTIRKK